MPGPCATRAPWTTAARDRWLAEVDAWAGAKLATAVGTSSTRSEIARERAWSIVVRFDTDEGAFYFKACASGGAHEPALLEHLSGRWPTVVPAPIAVERDAGWLLMPHRGVTLRRHLQGGSSLATWKALLPAYARLQIASAAECEQLVAAGVPDRRLHRLPLLLRGLLDDLVHARTSDGLSRLERQAMLEAIPRLERECAQLAAAGIPECIDHGDLHNGNVLVEDGRTWLVDWADSSVTHPFCSLLVTLDTIQHGNLDLAAGEAVALREAYLTQWEGFASRPGLEELFPVAMHVAHVIRALDWHRMLAGAPDEARARFEPYPVRWLRCWYARGQ